MTKDTRMQPGLLAYEVPAVYDIGDLMELTASSMKFEEYAPATRNSLKYKKGGGHDHHTSRGSSGFSGATTHT